MSYTVQNQSNPSNHTLVAVVVIVVVVLLLSRRGGADGSLQKGKDEYLRGQREVAVNAFNFTFHERREITS